MEFLNRDCHTGGAALSRDHRAAANADPNPARLMNVRAAWKGSHRFRMPDQSDSSVSIVSESCKIFPTAAVRNITVMPHCFYDG
jgi:hypothetical protein